mmetsp:Transcript_17624/g.21114  ORF Transcript_17624/g.21114 Transcript_17624/m.21114 type:complete len:110 (-) Transcript_17624:459-788(-)
MESCAHQIRQALDSAPSNTTEEQQAASFQRVKDSILKVRENDIDPLIATLTPGQVDLLMKYLYKGLAVPDAKLNAVLLLWHEKLTAVGGVGCIMRSLTNPLHHFLAPSN